MSFTDKVLTFLGSKWFTLFLGLALIVALPFTWHNFKVLQEAGQLAKYWYLTLVFIINILSVFLCVYKFMGTLGKKKPVIAEEW
jgi:hypothetical protein